VLGLVFDRRPPAHGEVCLGRVPSVCVVVGMVDVWNGDFDETGSSLDDLCGFAVGGARFHVRSEWGGWRYAVLFHGRRGGTVGRGCRACVERLCRSSGGGRDGTGVGDFGLLGVQGLQRQESCLEGRLRVEIVADVAVIVERHEGVVFVVARHGFRGIVGFNGWCCLGHHLE